MKSANRLKSLTVLSIVLSRHRLKLHLSFFFPTDVNDIYPEVSSLKDPELQSAQLAAKARFLPDYTVRAVTNIQYLRITAEHYLLARRLTAWVTKLHPQGKLPLTLPPVPPPNSFHTRLLVELL